MIPSVRAIAPMEAPMDQRLRWLRQARALLRRRLDELCEEENRIVLTQALQKEAMTQ